MDKQEALFEYCLRLGDDSLIQGHRLSEWCGHGPILEEDIATTNIALDLVGQATEMLKYAGEVEGKGRSEDDLAYHRDVLDFRNSNLVEQPNGNYGDTIVRQFLFDAYQYLLNRELQKSKDERIAERAAKSIKETQYHLRHSKQWLIRLGDGTEESHQKVQHGLNTLWMYTADMFETDAVDERLHQEGIAPDLTALKKEWDEMVADVVSEATLEIPENKYMFTGGRKGHHTEHLGYILAEMQFLPRAYPDAEW